jgi:hypothetical protein
LIFLNASGNVLTQTDVAVLWNVDVNNNQFANYIITATAPTGTAKVRVQSAINCNYMKLDAMCLRANTAKPLARMATPAISSTSGSKVTQPEFSVTVSPNPVISSFNLGINSSNNNTMVDIRIMDINGRVLAIHKTSPNSTMKIAAEKWTSGMYLVEVTQGTERKIVKLIKTN